MSREIVGRVRLIRFKRESENFLRVGMESAGNWLRVLKLLFQLYCLSLKVRILRAKLLASFAREAKLLRERFNLIGQKRELDLKQVNHVLTQPRCGRDADSVLTDVVCSTHRVL